MVNKIVKFSMKSIVQMHVKRKQNVRFHLNVDTRKNLDEKIFNT